MPSYAHVAVDLMCPGCGHPVTDLLRIAWGYCPANDVRYPYQLGEAIRWRVCRDGVIPPWTYFGPAECNVGDPAYEDLVLLDDWLIGVTHDCLTRLGWRRRGSARWRDHEGLDLQSWRLRGC